MSDWDDLRERLHRAEEGLVAAAKKDLGPERSAHLQSKAEGVRLALSYMREYEDTAPPEKPRKTEIEFDASQEDAEWLFDEIADLVHSSEERIHDPVVSSMPVTPPTVRVNDYVWVQLTEKGQQVLKQQYDSIGLDISEYHQIDGDWQRFLFWELLDIFGEATYLGWVSISSCFMEVRLTEPEEGP